MTHTHPASCARHYLVQVDAYSWRSIFKPICIRTIMLTEFCQCPTVISFNQYRLRRNMTNSNTLSLNLMGAFGSIIETTAMLDQLLRPEGYAKDTIADIATAIFVDNERTRIYEDASMHLIAIKKTLLYAIPS